MTGQMLATSPLLYAMIGIGIISIILFAVYSFIRTRNHCLEIGISQETINAVIKSTVSAALVPSLAILLGFIVLAASLGVAWPWWRLSVIGSLAYETMAAQYTADGMGISLSSVMTDDATIFAAIMIVMTIGILFEPISIAIVGKKYSTGIMTSKSGSKGDWGIVFSGVFYLAMFAVYVPIMIFTALPSTLTLYTSALVTLIMGILAKKKPIIGEFTMAAALIIGMASSVGWVHLFG